jgi:hypothetical protein
MEYRFAFVSPLVRTKPPTGVVFSLELKIWTFRPCERSITGGGEISYSSMVFSGCRRLKEERLERVGGVDIVQFLKSAEHIARQKLDTSCS